MKCPDCGAWSVILETRSSPVRYRRRRECANGHPFTTEEVVVTRGQIEQERSERLKTGRAKHVESIRKS
jgi:transcriptional regulator NrdR family protein